MKLLKQKRVGLIIRTFNTKPDLVDDRVARVFETVVKALELKVDGDHVFSRVDIIVAADPQYADCDCGDTRDEIVRTIAAMKSDEAKWMEKHDSVANLSILDLINKIYVSEVKKGDIFVGLLNFGIMKQVRDRIDYSVIISSGVNSYMTPENVGAMLSAIEEGALVAGMAIDELSELTMRGRIANTFAMWDNQALGQVGLFDYRAAKPRKDDKQTLYLQGWSEELERDKGNGEVFYHRAGVEEITPLVRLGRTFGPCIAPIVPIGEGLQWVAPDPIKDPEGYARHLKKLGTKAVRQEAWMFEEGVDETFLEGMVLPKYRK